MKKLTYILAPRGEEKPRLNYLAALACFFFLLNLVSCSADQFKAFEAVAEIVDDNSPLTDGGTYDVEEETTPDPCAKDADGNNLYASCPEEEVENTDRVTISTQAIGFQSNEVGAIECSSITIPNNLPFSAELDRNASGAIEPSELVEANCTEAAMDATFTHEFVFKTASGSYSEDRLNDAQGDLTICYVRGCLGDHSAQVKLVINGDNATTSSAYAYVIQVSGHTDPIYFTIDTPKSMQIIHPDVSAAHGGITGVQATDSDYVISTSGTLNTNLDYLFLNVTDPTNSTVGDYYEDGSTPITITVDGIKAGAKLDGGAFSLEELYLPKTAGIYTIEYARETNRDYTLTKDVDVVVPAKPTIEMEVRDSGGVAVTTGSTSDLAKLYLGVKISNLEVAGPTSTFPAYIWDVTFNGTSLVSGSKEMNYEASEAGDENYCLDDEGKNEREGFDGTKTYCIPLGSITKMQSGVNTIAAQATNGLGTTRAEFQLILDNSKPVIVISSPRENELCNVANTNCQISVDDETSPYYQKLKLTGYVKNYAPVEGDEGDIPDLRYCIPATESPDDTTCPVSSIKLWVNTSITYLPIYVYPVATEIPGDNTREKNTYIASESSGTHSAGNCYETTASETEYAPASGSTVDVVVDGEGNITSTSTEKDDDDVVTNTTVVTTYRDGHITKVETAADGTATTENVYTPNAATDSRTVATAAQDDGTYGTTELDYDLDQTTTYTTDPNTGEITSTVTSRSCNVPYGAFDLTLDMNALQTLALSTDVATDVTASTTTTAEGQTNKLNYYTNIVEMQALSISQHSTIAVRTFQVGETNRQNFQLDTNRKYIGDLQAGSMGTIDHDCQEDVIGQPIDDCIERAPIMLNISEGILNSENRVGNGLSQKEKITAVLEKFMNENVNFADLASGGALPQTDPDDDDDTDIDLEADFKREYEDSTGTSYPGYDNLDYSWKQQFIQEALHSGSMAMEYWALIRYRDYKNIHTYFEREGEYEGDQNTRAGWNIAADSCGHVITDLFMPVKHYQYVYKATHPDATSEEITEVLTDTDCDESNEDNPDCTPEWPKVAGTDVNYDDFVVGRWKIDDFDIDDEGYINIDACLVPRYSTVTSCAEEITDDNNPEVGVNKIREPAFWGHFIALDVAKCGLLGEYPVGSGACFNDDTFDLIWNIGKVRLHLDKVIRLEKSRHADEILGDDGDWTNKLTINMNNFKLDIIDEVIAGHNVDMFDPKVANNSLVFEPYKHCVDYYHHSFNYAPYPLGLSFDQETEYKAEDMLPYGCSNDSEENYPIAFEKNSVTGQRVYDYAVGNGTVGYLPQVLWAGVLNFFRGIVDCIGDEKVNPMISPDVFSYPIWVPESKQLKVDGTYYVDKDLGITDDENADDLLANITTTLSQSDLQIQDGGITFRLPLTMGVNDITNPLPHAMTESSLNLSNLASNLKQSVTTLVNPTERYVPANTRGHTIRTHDDLKMSGLDQTYPLTSADPTNDTFASLSINLEEFLNGVTYLVFKKGPLSLLSLFDEEMEDKLQPIDDYTVGIDKVILGNFDICDDLVKLLMTTDLPPGILFSDIANFFESALHLDIIFNKDNPPTFYMDKAENFDDKGMDFKIGLTNLQISVKNLYVVDDGDNETSWFTYKYDMNECRNPASVTLSSEEDVARYCPEASEVIRLRVDAVLSMKAVYDATTHSMKMYLGKLSEQNLHLSVINRNVSYDDNVIVGQLYETIASTDSQLGIGQNLTFTPDPNTVSPDPDYDGYSDPTMSIAFGGDSLSSFNDFELTNNLKQGETGSCEGLTKPIYVPDAATAAATAAAAAAARRDAITDAMNEKLSQTNLATLPASLREAAEEEANPYYENDLEDLGNGDENEGFQNINITQQNIGDTIKNYNEHVLEDPCYMYSFPNSNPIKDALCDFGIDDLTFNSGSPTVIFDTDNGYLHLGLSMNLETYDWLTGVESETKVLASRTASQKMAMPTKTKAKAKTKVTSKKKKAIKWTH